MTKEFQINDILKAVSSISRIERKKNKNSKKNELAIKNDVLSTGKQAKSSKSEILVLNQMIE